VNEDVAITERRDGDRAVITVKGEIDVASAPALRTQLHAVCVEGVSAVVLDLREVTFLDSSALGVLVGALRRCREVGNDFKLVITSPRLLKIFEITGLTSVFDITGTLE
jgi:anti-sigma B factor antagonist